MNSTHPSHAVTCESCGCVRECDGHCTTCSICGATWLLVRCLHCGEVPIYSDEPEYRAIIDIVTALRLGYCPLGAMTCPHCRGEIMSKDVRWMESRQ